MYDGPVAMTDHNCRVVTHCRYPVQYLEERSMLPRVNFEL